MRLNKVKMVSILVLGMVVGISFVPAIVGFDTPNDEVIKEIVLVRTSDSNDIRHLETLGANVIEIYEQYVLIEIVPSMTHLVKEMDNSVEKIKNYDYVGLQAYSFNVAEGMPEIPQHREISSYSSEDQGYYIIQFIGPIKMEWQDELTELGVRIHEFRHKFNLITEMDSSTKEEIEKLYYVNWVGIYQPAYKFNVDLLEETGSLVVDIYIFKTQESSEIAKKITDFGGDIQHIHRNWITVQIDSERIESIATLPGINSITKATTEYRVFNDDATWITQTNEQNNRKVTDAGITGLGQIITVMDSELYGGNSNNPDHEMWADSNGNPVGENHRKIVEHYVPVGANGDLNNGAYHGTHVVGTVLGDSPLYNSYSNHDGNALEARLIFQDIDEDGLPYIYPPSNMYTNAWAPSYASGSWVHTNSWGGGSGYSATSLSGDLFIWDHKDYNILFAMGNSGSGANTLSGQAEGKNIISVGGVTNYPNHNTMYSSSSRGYANDGRIKPTILHVAQYVTSAARSTSGYSSLSGTSMATPGIAGQVGQVRQYYEEGWYPGGLPNPSDGFNPSNALVRATLINGAVEITGSGAYQNDNRFPNGDQGYGCSKLDRVLHFDGDERNLIVYDSWNDGVELNTGESWDMTFVVLDPDQDVEVTLAWSDYPGSSGSNQANPAIVNDLDLEVIAPDGTRYVGNAFTGFNPGYSGPDPTSNPWNGLRTGEFDGLNVEENVLLLPNYNGVQLGVYEVIVTAYQVSQGSQPFAVVISGGVIEELPGEPPSVTVTRPDGGEIWEANTVEKIIWTTIEGDDLIESVTLFYSIDDGSSWTVIDTGLNDTGEYFWNVPNVHSTECLVRVRVRDIQGRFGENISDNVFMIQGVPPAPPEDLMVEHISAPIMSVFDDFSDGNLDNWTIYVGSWDASEGYLQGHGSISALGEINGVTIEGYGRWEYDFNLQRTSSAGGERQRIRNHFIQINNPDTRYSSGYYVLIESYTFLWWTFGSINLWRWDSGSTPANSVISSSWNPDTNLHTLVIERDETGIFNMYLDDQLLGSGSDNTYTTSEYLGFRHSENLGSEGDHIIHEIRAEVMGEDEDHNLITWMASPDDPSEVDYYTIYRSEQNTGPWDTSTKIGSVSADGSTVYEYVDEFKGLADDVFWWYVVRAVGANGLEEGNTDAVREPGTEDCYTLDISIIGSGEVLRNPDGFCYDVDTVVELTPEAYPGWSFVGWSGPHAGDLVDNGGYWSIVMDDDKQVTAIFVADTSPLIISNVLLSTSDPLDTDLAFGWVNFSCEVTSNVSVDTVTLHISSPEASWDNASMIPFGDDEYYFNITFTDHGQYNYFIWAIDTLGQTGESEFFEFLMPPNWDINMDGICDIWDVSLLSAQWMNMGDPGWIREDVNNDGMVDIWDISILSTYWIESWV